MCIGLEALMQPGSHVLATAVQLPAVKLATAGVSSHMKSWLGMMGMAGLVCNSAYLQRAAARQREQEERLRRELMAYLTLDLPSSIVGLDQFARLVSQTIATRSSFARAALMLRDERGLLTVVSSAGMDGISVDLLNRWGANAEELLSGGTASQANRVGACSFTVQLEQRTSPPPRGSLAALGCARVHVIPVLSAGGLLGAIAVCADTRPSLGRCSGLAQMQLVLEPLEALALRLGTQLLQGSKTARPRNERPVPGIGRERMPDRRRARVAHVACGEAGVRHALRRASDGVRRRLPGRWLGEGC